MRTISINLFRFNELDEKSRLLARTELLDGKDFVINTNNFIDVRAEYHLRKVVPSEIFEAMKIFTIYYGRDCVSVELRTHIETKPLLQRFAEVSGWGKSVEFFGDIDIRVATDSMLPHLFPDDECSTQIARYLDNVAWSVKDSVVEDLERYLSDDGLADYCVVHDIEFETDGRICKSL